MNDRSNEIDAFSKEIDNYYQRIIESSKTLLLLQENWDDDGAKIIQNHTWEKAISFLKRYYQYLVSNHNAFLEVPDISAVNDGSIDLLWQNDQARLLVNIKENNTLASYYGDNYTNTMAFKGFVSLEHLHTQFAGWLLEFTR